MKFINKYEEYILKPSSNKTEPFSLLWEKSMETKEDLSKCQRILKSFFVWKSKKKLFRKKCDTAAKYNFTLDTVVQRASNR